MEGGNKLVLFLKRAFVGEHCSMVRMQTVWKRLKAGTYYPNVKSLQFELVSLFYVLCCIEIVLFFLNPQHDIRTAMCGNGGAQGL
jgi:glycopeptide antibiotics resistance protein